MATKKKAAPKAAAKKAEEPKKATRTVVLTAEDLEINPDLATQGYKVGDAVEVEDENDTDAEAKVAPNAPKAAKADLDEVDVIEGTRYVRSYSEAVHGPDFRDLAEEFCSKRVDAKIVDPATVKSVVVAYRSLDKKTGVSFHTTRRFTDKREALRFAAEQNGDVRI